MKTKTVNYDFEAGIKEMFWSRVQTGEIVKCWPWKLSDSHGYGQIWINGYRYLTHRLAWSLSNDLPITPGMCICHHCDNRICCNPHHLFLGSIQDNDKDRDQKGHTRGGILKGEDNPRAKLTEAQVREIRKSYSEHRFNQYELADLYGVTRCNIGLIVRNVSWKSVTP